MRGSTHAGSRARVVAFAFACAAALVMSACASSAKPGSAPASTTSSTTSTPASVHRSSTPLSKAQYVKQAEAICTKAQADISVFAADYDPQAGLAELQQRYNTELAPVLRREVTDLQALTPPAADRAKLSAMLDDLSQGNEQALALIQAAKTVKEIGSFAQPAKLVAAGRVARAYGLPECDPRR